MTPDQIGLIFSVGDLASKLTTLLGLVESIDKKIDRLSKSELDSGYRLLVQTNDAKYQKEFLLREAWAHFNKAISLESELRLASAYLGLAFCQFHLNEKELAEESLQRILKLEIKRDGMHLTKQLTLGVAVVAAGIVFPIAGFLLLIGGAGIALLDGEKRGKLLEKVNDAVNSYIGLPKNEKLSLLQGAIKMQFPNITEL